MSELHKACGHPWSDHNAHGCTDMYCHCKVPGEPKNQELPPLDVALLSEMSKRDDFMIVGSQVRHLIGMYRAALNELKAKDTELAAKEARIAELTGCKFSDRSHAALKDRAEAAEKSLGAVSEVLKEHEEWKMATIERLQEICEENGCPAGWNRFDFLSDFLRLQKRRLQNVSDGLDAEHRTGHIDHSQYARLRSIVEGK